MTTSTDQRETIASAAFVFEEEDEAVVEMTASTLADSLETWRELPAVTSWFDFGVRLDGLEPDAGEIESTVAQAAEADGNEVVAADGNKVAEAEKKEPISVSAEASLAAGAISALGVLGIDIASVGVVENMDAALFVGAAVMANVDADNAAGAALRTVGNVTTEVVSVTTKEVIKPTAKFYVENEVGLKSRALLELGIEALIKTIDPKRAEEERRREEAKRRLAEEAARLAARQAEKDALPWWDPSKYGA